MVEKEYFQIKAALLAVALVGLERLTSGGLVAKSRGNFQNLAKKSLVRLAKK